MNGTEIRFEDAITLAENIIQRFEKIENKSWGVEGAMIELQKQVGELSRFVMIHEGYYFDGGHDQNESIADELADIFYSVVRIARHYGIDLASAHIREREKEDIFLNSKAV